MPTHAYTRIAHVITPTRRSWPGATRTAARTNLNMFSECTCKFSSRTHANIGHISILIYMHMRRKRSDKEFMAGRDKHRCQGQASMSRAHMCIGNLYKNAHDHYLTGTQGMVSDLFSFLLLC